MKRKKCSKCRKRKSVTMFYRSKASSDGYGAQCKQCMDETRKRNKLKAAAAPKIVPERKKCRNCGKVKTASAFSASPTSADGLYSYCKPCKASMVKVHRDRNRDTLNRRAREKAATPDGKRQQRDENLKRKYGVTHEYYETRLKEQGGVCAICKRAPVEGEKHFSIDHEHDEDDQRGRVHVTQRRRPPGLRGVLCEECNRALGLANDDVEVLLAGARYLERHIRNAGR